MAAEQSGDFYVGIHDPVAVRRNILESSKAVIQVLQRQEELKRLRREKEEEIERFARSSAEIAELMGKLKANLPKVNPAQLPKKPSAKRESMPAGQKTLSDDGNFERLDQQLRAIEEKLKNL